MNIVVGVAAIVIGLGFVIAGRGNVSSRLSSETGARRLVTRATGTTGEHVGGVAVAHGWMRVLVGVALIIFGILFMALG